MNTEYNEPTPYPTEDAHWEAYWKIDPHDRESGRLALWDYALDYQGILGEPHQDTPAELLAYLNDCPPIRKSRSYLQFKQVFADIGMSMPTGMEDLPECWLCGIHRFILEMLWVDRDTQRVKDFFDWSIVLRQGPYLEIHYGKEIPRSGPIWPDRASLLLEFHRFLEPGAFTSRGRLQEFV